MCDAKPIRIGCADNNESLCRLQKETALKKRAEEKHADRKKTKRKQLEEQQLDGKQAKSYLLRP
jgi:hypothetical protein